MDPENAIVKLCAAGMKAETGGANAEAERLFLKAWGAATTEYERCIAAHYVARHQADPLESLRWNQVAIDNALLVTDGSVDGFFGSLYLNLGYSYELFGNMVEARTNYNHAASRMADIPAGRYKEIVIDGVTRGLQRLVGKPQGIQ
jgi:hypothetical protein